MKLQSNKIYQRKYFRDAYLCPTLQIVGTAQIYVSNKATKPTSVSEMVELSNLEADSLNVITGMTRWICAVYTGDSNAVYEMGLVESPYIAKE